MVSCRQRRPFATGSGARPRGRAVARARRRPPRAGGHRPVGRSEPVSGAPARRAASGSFNPDSHAPPARRRQAGGARPTRRARTPLAFRTAELASSCARQKAPARRSARSPSAPSAPMPVSTTAAVSRGATAESERKSSSIAGRWPRRGRVTASSASRSSEVTRRWAPPGATRTAPAGGRSPSTATRTSRPSEPASQSAGPPESAAMC
jgi:hypothetical protein